MTGPYVLVFAILSFLSIFFGLGFFVIRVAPRELPFRAFRVFLRLRLLVPATALAVTVIVFVLAGLPEVAWWFVAVQAVVVLVDYISYEPRLFKAVKAPEFEGDPSNTTLDPSALVVVLEISGDARAYPLTYVAHHEIINDRVGGSKVVLSFCNLCNSANAFDVSSYSRRRGFEVVAEYRGNMILQDLDTHTIWQQLSGESLAGTHHPAQLPLVPSRILLWSEAHRKFPNIKLAKTTLKDRLPFDIWFLPWSRLQKSSYVLGLRPRDNRLPARTRVIGVERIGGHVCYLADEMARERWTRNDEIHLLIVMTGAWAIGFLTEVDGIARDLIVQDERIVDGRTGSSWNLEGHGRVGPLSSHRLVVWPMHEVFWFAWSAFHPLTRIIRLGRGTPDQRSTPSSSESPPEAV